jgi:L-lactate dehydrogenase complex protein LldE
VDAPSGVYELSEFLVDVLKVEDVGAYFPHTVTYHPTCHSLRSLRVGDRPHALLSSVRGLTLLPLGAADECCGFGGTFSLKNPAVSAAMCTDKVRNVLDTGAEVLCATDNSCLMHIGGTMRRERAGVRVMHLAQILASTEEAPA